MEDYVRFALDDPALTRRLKEVRHRLADALKGLDPERLLASRDTRGDVGTHIMTASEQARENPRAVLLANFKRTAEALRSLEEYGKLVDIWVSGRFEVLRYDVYTLEKLTLTAIAARATWDDVNLMVLVGGLPTLGDLTWVVEEALAGGAGAIQLREKGLTDRELLTRAREVRILTSKARARFILNDRPDLARLAGADAVHLGQDDVRPAGRPAGRRPGAGDRCLDARPGPGRARRPSTERATSASARPSPARRRTLRPGRARLRRRPRGRATGLPWFAIGGITLDNLDEVIEAGARRVAVSSAVVRAEFPRQATAALRRPARRGRGCRRAERPIEFKPRANRHPDRRPTDDLAADQPQASQPDQDAARRGIDGASVGHEYQCRRWRSSDRASEPSPDPGARPSRSCRRR